MSVQSQHHMELVSSRKFRGQGPCDQQFEPPYVEYHIQIVLKGMGLRAEYIHEVTWIRVSGALF